MKFSLKSLMAIAVFSLAALVTNAQQMTITNYSSCDMLVQIQSKDGSCTTYNESVVVGSGATTTVTVANGDYVIGARVRIDGCATSPTGLVKDCSASGCTCTNDNDDTFISPTGCCGAGDTVLIEFTPDGTDGTLIIDMYP